MVRIENITKADAFTASNGVKWSLAFSPGLAVVHTDKAPIFTAGKKDRGKGLEAQAEDGNPATLAKSPESDKEIKSVVVFNTPMGQKSPGPVGPGAAYECSIETAPGSKLAVTSMFGQSNDLFYAPNESGIALFSNSKPISGDITAKIILWDAGTEVNEEPGIGPNQAPRRKAPDTGKDENSVVKNIKDIKNGFNYPKTASVMKVTITPSKSAAATN